MKGMEAKKSKNVATRTPALAEPVVRFLTPLVTVLLGAGLVLFALVALGRFARDRLSESERYTIRFDEIECLPPPPGQDRAAFLGEVQYLAELPEQIRLLDDDLVRRLAGAFLRHPWVERVERVSRGPRQVRVWLTYRAPVLAVPADGQLRAVDGHGILLPPGADVTGLPVFKGKARPPAGAAGALWGDAAVEAAARAAAARRAPH